MKLDELVTRLQTLPKRDFGRMARETGVPWRTARNIRAGVTQNPRAKTVEPLADWLEQHSNDQ